MKKLNEMSWHEYDLKKIFSVRSGKRLTNEDKIDGSRPFIGATDNNNGVTGFVSNNNESLDKNVLGVNYNGAPCIAFYHPYECIFTDDVKRLHLLHHGDNENILLFFKNIIMQQKTKYTYGYKFKEKRMLRQKLMIPVNENKNPDYAYMEQYVSEMKKNMLMRYKKYIIKQISSLRHKDIQPLSEKTWAPILLSSAFTCLRGRENNMAMLSSGSTPLISAKANNNGLKAFVSTKGKTIIGGCITLNNDGDGGAGLAYYQPFEMALDTHVTALIPKRVMSKWTMLFIAECLSELHNYYGHGLSISKKRTKNIRVMLPVKDDGKPDYLYMEQYAKNMMLKKYKQYLDFLDAHDAGK